MDNPQEFIDFKLKTGEIIKINKLGIIKDKKIFGKQNDYLFICSKSFHFRVHELVYLAFYGKQNSKYLYINHIDGNKQNNNLNNLELVSSSYSSCHMRYMLNKSCGNGKGSLTIETLKQIIEDIKNHQYAYEVALKNNLDTRLIRKINNGLKYNYALVNIFNINYFPINNFPDFNKRKSKFFND